jgi:hypothetical protein
MIGGGADGLGRGALLLAAGLAGVIPIGASAARAAPQRGAGAVSASSPKLFYRALADVDGDGRQDVVTLTALEPGTTVQPSGGLLRVELASGPVISVTTGTDAPYLPGLVRVGNINGRPGEELFVDVGHLTTEEDIAVYTYAEGRLLDAGTFAAYGEEYGIRSGITCSSRAGAHLLTEHAFELRGRAGRRWWERNTVYGWAGTSLRLRSRGSAQRISGGPPAALVGVQCGHVPAPAPLHTPNV